MELAVSACAGTGNLIWATLGSLLFPLYKSTPRSSTPLWPCCWSGALGRS